MGIDRLTMFLSNQFNIKEVLLFPAMKPLDEALERARRLMGVQNQSSMVQEELLPSIPLPELECDLSSLSGRERLEEAIQGKTFMGEEGRPSSLDRVAFVALSQLPRHVLVQHPTLNGYFSTLNQFSEQARIDW